VALARQSVAGRGDAYSRCERMIRHDGERTDSNRHSSRVIAMGDAAQNANAFRSRVLPIFSAAVCSSLAHSTPDRVNAKNERQERSPRRLRRHVSRERARSAQPRPVCPTRLGPRASCFAGATGGAGAVSVRLASYRQRSRSAKSRARRRHYSMRLPHSHARPQASRPRSPPRGLCPPIPVAVSRIGLCSNSRSP